jgi:hypothetical protein
MTPAKSDRAPVPTAARLIAVALGAAAFGAMAVGALAIGRAAIGRLAIKKARFGTLEVDELVVRRLRVIESQDVNTTVRNDPGRHTAGI